MDENEANEKAPAADGEHADDTSAGFDPALEQWLHSEVAAAYDELKADPSRALTIEQVKEELALLHKRHMGGTSSDERV